MQPGINTPILDKLTPSRPLLSVSDFIWPCFMIALGLLLAIGLPIAAEMNPEPAKNALPVEIFIAIGIALVIGGLIYAAIEVSYERRMRYFMEESFEYRQLYRNRYVTVSVLYPFMRSVYWTFAMVVLGVLGVA
jgi:hypothetical protein